MRRTRLPLATKSAKGRSVALTAETLVNMYAEQAEGGSRNALALVGCPGATVFSTPSSDYIRGIHWVPVNNTLWVVSGLSLYKVDSAGSASTIGTIGGYGRVSLADNGVELCITTEAITYVVTLATDTLTAVTDSDFPNADTVAFLGGYFFFNNNQSGTKGQLFWSSLYGGSTYDALDFATAENAPDNLVAVWRDHDRLLLFGDDTTESWFLTGDDTIVAPYKGSVINRGLGARWSVANVDNSVLFLDDNGIVRRIGGQGGYSAERVSTHALENDIAQGSWRHDDATAYDGAVASTYIEEGHEFYVLTIPGRSTWVFDAATRLWHKRKSKSMEASRLSFHVLAFDKVICGDTQNGKIYEQKLSYKTEDGNQIIAEIQFPPLHKNGERFRVHELELNIEASVPQAAPEVVATHSFSSVSKNVINVFATTGIKQVLPYVGPGYALRVYKTASDEYLSWSAWSYDGDPNASGLPWGSYVKIRNGEDEYIGNAFGDWFATQAEAEAYGLATPLHLPGDDTYTLYVTDSNPSDNRGGHTWHVDVYEIAGSGDGEEARVMLDVLSDGNRVPDVTQQYKRIGTEGEYSKRIIWRRLGQHRQFTPRFTISAPIGRLIFDATARISSDG